MNADRPTPNSDSARPDATWLACSVSVTTANTSESAAPASMPATTPSHGDLVVAATMNATTAPTSIIPSTPRFSTPDFSVTSSPSAGEHERRARGEREEDELCDGVHRLHAARTRRRACERCAAGSG